MTRGKIHEGVDFFAAATPQHPATQEKQRHIRSQRRGQIFHRKKIETLPAEVLQPQQSGGGVGAGASQSAAQRNRFRNPHLNASTPAARLPPSFACAINQVAGSGRHSGIIAFHLSSLPTFRDADIQAVMQANGLVDGAKFVITVGTLAENLQSVINLGKRPDAKCFWQS